MESKVIHIGPIEIFTESFGLPQDPAVLLIMGATAQGVMWHDDFCETLAGSGFFVIRYDHRDTGKSSRIDYANQPYYLHDLASDALSILDLHGIKSAHFVGASMGGQVAQTIAIHNSDRVSTLTCIMSTPNHLVFVDGFEGKDVTHHGLPASNPKILKYYQAILGIKAATQDEALALHKEALQQIMALPEHMVEVRMFEGRILKRLKSLTHIHNHSLALAASKDLHEDLHRISLPSLIIHGSEDFILPIEHGRKLAHLIKDSNFIEYKHMGHCFSAKIFSNLLDDLKKFWKKNSKNSRTIYYRNNKI